MHFSVPNNIEGIHRLNPRRKRLNERLTFFGLYAFDGQLGIGGGSLVQESRQAVAHDAMGVDQQSGFRHAVTPCAALPEHSWPRAGHQHGPEVLAGRRPPPRR